MTHADVGARQASAAGPDLGAMPVWNLGDLYPSPTSAEFQRDLDRAAADAKRIAETLQGQARHPRQGRGGAGRSRQGLRGAERRDGQARLVCRPAVCRRHHRPGQGQVLRRRAGEADRHLHRPGVLRAGAQPDRRGRSRRGDAGAGARRLQAVVRRPAQGEALSARGAARAPVQREIGDGTRRPGAGCSARP